MSLILRTWYFARNNRKNAVITDNTTPNSNDDNLL